MSSNYKYNGKYWPLMVCVFLMLATAISYLDRNAFSVVAPLIRDEMDLNNEQLGQLLSAFFFSYAFMHLFVGYFLDNFNIRYTYGIFVILWSLAQMFTGFTRTFTGLFGARIGLGTFESAGQTGAARVIARIIPQKDRPLANGIMMSGGSIGAILAPIIMISLSTTVGWRTGFIILGCVGIVWSTIWIIWFRPPEYILTGKSSEGKRYQEGDQWRVIFRNPKFWACAIAAAFVIPILHVSGTWIPTYFIQEWNQSLNAELAIVLTIVYIGLDVGFIVGGMSVSILCRKNFKVGQARKIVMTVCAVLMSAVASISYMPSILFAIVLVVLLNMGRAAWGALFLSFNQEIAPGRVGMITGIMGAIGSLSGAILIWLIGILTADSGSFRVPFIIIGCMAIIGTLAILMIKWDQEEISSEMLKTETQSK